MKTIVPRDGGAFPAGPVRFLGIRRAFRLSATVAMLGALVLCARAATNVWCAHVTHAAGWKTSIAVYNPTTWNVEFWLAKYAENGALLEAPAEESVSPGTWITLPDSELDYEGTANIASTDNLLVKAMFQAGDSPSVSEFFLTNEMQKTWCNNSGGQAQIVGQKDPNPWNLRDLHGNVREWCWDWYAGYPANWQTDYTGPATGSSKVARGGSWNDVAWQLRSANRHTGNPNGRGRDLGFRLVRTLFAGY